MLNCLQRMALKEEETSSSDEDDEVTHVDESDDGEDDTDEDEEGDKEVGVAAITAVQKSEKNVIKSEGGKLDKTGLNEFLVKLRRPITQAKVIFGFLLLKLSSFIVHGWNPLNSKFKTNLQVHVIHKLTKDISMLRRKKTKNEADKSKNERKVARFVQEVQVMT